jgi:hypothetical protein
MNQIPKKRRIYRAFTSEARATARTSGIIVPKSPSDPASSERLNRNGGRVFSDTGISRGDITYEPLSCHFRP